MRSANTKSVQGQVTLILAEKWRSLHDYHLGQGRTESDAILIADRYEGQQFSDAWRKAGEILDHLGIDGSDFAVPPPSRTLAAARHLAELASYSEIVGSMGTNRPHIRKACDAVFEIVREQVRAEEAAEDREMVDGK